MRPNICNDSCDSFTIHVRLVSRCRDLICLILFRHLRARRRLLHNLSAHSSCYICQSAYQDHVNGNNRNDIWKDIIVGAL